MIEAEQLSQSIATNWDQITLHLGNDRETFERQLTPLLRRLEGTRGLDQAAVIRSILELFQKFDAAHKQLIEAINWFSKGAGIPAGSMKMDRYTSVPVCYGTDRSVENSHGGGRISYGCERGELSVGVAEVSIPDDHRMGEIEKPRLWKLQFREDPQKHVVLLGVEPLSIDAFAARVQGALNRSSKKEVLLFVHGYNVGFADAVCRAAQIAYDLHFEGLPALYSWPSEGSVPKYVVDETNVAWSRPRFAIFLGLLREKMGAEGIHIIAHSMGNRLIAESVACLAIPINTHGAPIRQIVLAAPDIDASTFRDLATAFHGKAERFTLYASSEDKAIKASRLIHKYPRAGDSGLGLVVVGSVDTVDAAALDTSFVGHSYYGDNRSVLTDIFELIRRGSPPQERFGLVPKERYGARYWLFSP
ncbi:MAG TPA: alpha/beta hydrolase [Terriglobia bacterium]|nr:alpha/beta hydrolase [Terriglobia bacterium]